jgi:hypothetical protein
MDPHKYALTGNAVRKVKDGLHKINTLPNINQPRRRIFHSEGNKIRIFQVTTAGTGTGIYTCVELVLDKTNWALMGIDKFRLKDLSATPATFSIQNLAESGGLGSALETGDRMYAWQTADDERTKRWVGVPFENTGSGIRITYCAEDAPESDQIRCFQDYDGTDPAVWTERAFLAGNTVSGDGDGEVYRCTQPHTGTSLTRPATGANWAQYWALISQIDVVCHIHGGYNLEDANPLLLTTHKSLAYPGGTPLRWSTWTPREFVQDEIITGDDVDGTAYYCLADYDATADTEETTRPTSGTNWATHWAIKVFAEGEILFGSNRAEYFGCLVGHTGTSDTRPSSGELWEDYWECWLRKAGVLRVYLNRDGEWEALDTFSAAFAGGATNP